MWFFGCSCAFTLGLPLELIKIHVMVAKLMSHCSSMYYTSQSESRIYYYLVVQFLLLQLDITRTHEKTVTATHVLTIRILMEILPFIVQYWHKRMNLYLYCWMLGLIQPSSTFDSSLPFMKLQELDFFRK